jgi:hypothetical protein
LGADISNAAPDDAGEVLAQRVEYFMKQMQHAD